MDGGGVWRIEKSRYVKRGHAECEKDRRWNRVDWLNRQSAWSLEGLENRNLVLSIRLRRYKIWTSNVIMVVRASLFRAIRIRFCQPPVERCSLFPSVFAACWWNAVEKRTRSEEKSKPKKILGSFLCPLAVGLQRRGCLTYFQHVFHFPRPITAIYPSPISCPPREFVFFSDDFNGLFFDIALPSYSLMARWLYWYRCLGQWFLFS